MTDFEEGDSALALLIITDKFLRGGKPFVRTTTFSPPYEVMCLPENLLFPIHQLALNQALLNAAINLETVVSSSMCRDDDLTRPALEIIRQVIAKAGPARGR
jgi:hypothetical protein